MHSKIIQRWVLILSATFSVLLLAMAYILWNERQSKPNALGANNLASSIVIKRKGFDDIQLSKLDETWTMNSPCNVQVNEQRLSPLLEVLSPSAHEYDSQDVDLNAAGLESPQAIIIIDDIEYRLGNTDLQGERRYVQYNNQVAFIPEWTLSLINGGVSALADLNVFNNALNSLTVVIKNQTVRTIAESNELALWQDLSAQQIVKWPLEDNAAEAVFSILTDDVTSTQSLISVFNTDEYIAMQYNGSACAFIISPDSLPN